MGIIANTKKLAKWLVASALDVSPLVIIICAAAAVYYYRAQFDGGFSDESGDWSAFGSYVGGVFGPVISFVTLLAVLRTVYLQRQLLESQLKEFDRMNELQQKTFESQQAQLNRAAADAEQLQVSAAQDSAVKAVEMRMQMHERDFDRQHDMSFRYRNEFGALLNEVEHFERLQSIVEHRDRARASVDLLSKLALDISISRFSTVAEVRERLRLGMESIYDRLDETYPGTLRPLT